MDVLVICGKANLNNNRNFVIESWSNNTTEIDFTSMYMADKIFAAILVSGSRNSMKLLWVNRRD